MFTKTKCWLARWTWRKFGRLIAGALLMLLKEQSSELITIAKEDAPNAVKLIQDKVSDKLKK